VSLDVNATLLHCILSHIACPSVVTSSLWGYSSVWSIKTPYQHFDHNTVFMNQDRTLRSEVCSGWTTPIATSHSTLTHMIHRPQCVGSVNVPIRSSYVGSLECTSVKNSVVSLMKPTLSADAELLFGLTGEGPARLDTDDNTIWYPCATMESKSFCN
jgi:hypothetical protein